MKIFPTLLFMIALCCGKLSAQKVQLKKPFGKASQDTLSRVLKECFGVTNNLNSYYSSTELYNSNVYREADATMGSVEALKKKLDGSDADAPLLLELSGLYSRLGMPAEAKAALEQCLAIQLAKRDLYPDSAYLYMSLAVTYMAASDLENVVANYQKAWELDRSITNAPVMLMTIWMMASRVDSATAVVERYLKQGPCTKAFYEALPLYYLMKNAMQPAALAASTEELKTLSFEKVLDMPYIEAYYNSHRNELEAEYVYRVSRQINMSAIVPVRASADSSFDYENPRFRLSAADKKSLTESKAFFESCLKKDVKYQLYANKLLGRMYILLDEPAKAIPYLKKAIALKPPSNCSLSSNSNEDYEALGCAYYILKDNKSLEKLFLEKIDQRIAVDPVPRDYRNLASIYLEDGRYEKLKDIGSKGLVITPTDTELLAILGTGAYLQGNNEQAMDYVNRIFAIDSKTWELYMLYGTVLLSQGDVSNAYESFKTVERLHDRDWVRKELLEYFFTASAR